MYRIIVLLAGFVLLVNVAQAEEKSADDLCRQHNATNCGQMAAASAVIKTQAETSAMKPAVSSEVSMSASKQEPVKGYWGNPYFILLLIGLLQGMISSAGIGQFAIIGVAIPVIATWSMLSGAHFPSGITENIAYVGMELLGTFLFSMAGWVIGIAIRWGAYKLLFPA